MKPRSVSGLVCYVKNLDKTAEFYDKLGFQTKKQTTNKLTVNVNWFWIDFIPEDSEDKAEFKKEAKLANRGSGVFLYVSVADVDEAYKDLVDDGIKPSSEPKDWPWGNREFVVRDPDGYKLVIFKRK